MKNLTVSEDVEIILNGNKYLLEEGDEIILEAKNRKVLVVGDNIYAANNTNDNWLPYFAQKLCELVGIKDCKVVTERKISGAPKSIRYFLENELYPKLINRA